MENVKLIMKMSWKLKKKKCPEFFFKYYLLKLRLLLSLIFISSELIRYLHLQNTCYLYDIFCYTNRPKQILNHFLPVKCALSIIRIYPTEIFKYMFLKDSCLYRKVVSDAFYYVVSDFVL